LAARAAFSAFNFLDVKAESIFLPASLTFLAAAFFNA